MPEPLRTPGRELPSPVEVQAEPIVFDGIGNDSASEETAADGGEPAMAEDADLAEDGEVAEGDAPYAVAAE